MNNTINDNSRNIINSGEINSPVTQGDNSNIQVNNKETNFFSNINMIGATIILVLLGVIAYFFSKGA
jgi:hypothetical protein